MGEVRSCVCFLVLVSLKLAVGKPFFGTDMLCDFFCDDSDLDGTTTTLEDLIDSYFDPCSDCPTRRPTTPRVPTPNPMPFNFMIPPSSNGMNVTWNGGSWIMNFVPWGGPGGQGAPWGGQGGPWGGPGPGATLSPPVQAPPAAPAGTTAAPPTTAAGTSAAPTTAKK